ncbi:MAG TPA: polysaccharide biosynthesis C-terminal domain-containing protein [Bacillaceae bacterium]
MIRVVSFALLIVPPMSFLRGFFQGLQSMGPSAISTVLEQLARVLFIVAGAYFSLHVLGLSVADAVGVAVFGAFIGSVAGMGVLLRIFNRRKKLIFNGGDNQSVPALPLMKEVYAYAIPYIAISLGLPLYQLIDTYTINAVLMGTGLGQGEAENVNSVVRLVQTLVLIPVSITVGLSASLIPSMTRSFVEKDQAGMQKLFNQSILMLSAVILPAAIGMLLLGEPLYILLYGKENLPVLGGAILGLYAPAAILIAMSSLTTSMLQAVNQHKRVILGLAAALSVKLALNFWLPPFLQEDGFIIATYAGYSVSVIYNFWLLKKHFSLNLFGIRLRLASVLTAVVCMAAGISVLKKGLALHRPENYLVMDVATMVMLGMLIFAFTIAVINYPRYKRVRSSG